MGIEQKVQIIGIAKRLEEIFFPGDPVPLYLDKNSESLKVIQSARNEAHRFSLTHHRSLRSKESILSKLQKIKGIGEITRIKLFKHFKSIESIENAHLKDIEEVIGNTKAIIIYNHFKK